MTTPISCSRRESHQAISTEQLDQIVGAILAGKYSWACVLLLRFVGYNPLHYIPYRTHNRLIKENSQVSKLHHSLVGHSTTNRGSVVDFERRTEQHLYQ
ncbi:HetP family heterocyst commitment protein [Lyngbya aestuarii]|uniref:HetP family heterocyst commitment protein n=1 Tax=Lyngbya aestuarii TaxID=118322 RepID=UPI00403DCB6C